MYVQYNLSSCVDLCTKLSTEKLATQGKEQQKILHTGDPESLDRCG